MEMENGAGLPKPTTVPEQGVPPVVSDNRGKKKWVGVVLAIVAVVAVFVGSALAYVAYFQVTPEKLLKKSLRSFEKVQTARYDSSIHIESKIDAQEQSQFEQFGLAGTFDATVSSMMTLSKDLPRRSWLTMNLASAGKTVFAYEYRLKDDVGYFKIQTVAIPGLDVGSAPLPWVRISKQELEDKLSEYGALLTKGDAAGIFDKYNDPVKAEEVSEKIQRALLESGAVMPAGDIERVTVDGRGMYKIPVAFNAEGIARFYAAVLDAMDEPKMKEELLKNDEFLNELKEMVAAIESATIWLGRSDVLPYRIEVNIKAGEDVESASIAIAMKYNEPVEVAVPADSISLDEAIQNAMTYILGGGLSQPPIDAPTDADQDGLLYEQEVNVYHTDPTKKDTDGDGYSDGDEVNGGYNPLGPGKL